MLYRVYVDESGDRGLSAKSDKHFVVSAVIVADSDESLVRSELGATRGALGRAPGHVLHFRKLSHSQRLKSVQDLATFSIATTTNVIVHKDLLGQPMPAGNMAYIAKPDPMYLWALRLLLERISWFCDEHGGEAIVTFAHVRHFQARKLHDYRRALELTSGVQIRWPVFDRHPFRIASPNHVELLQAADIAASAVFKAVEPDDYGNREPRYLAELTPVLYRRGTANVTSYGLKVFPSAQANPGGSLDFLRQY